MATFPTEVTALPAANETTQEILSLSEIREEIPQIVSSLRKRQVDVNTAIKRIDTLVVMAAGLDPLVEKVANKALFDERLGVEMARAERTGLPLTLLVSDLDNFKAVNDIFGHDAGNEVLKRVGKIMRLFVKKTDTVARLGGDEFAVILPDTPVIRGLVAADRILTHIPTAAPQVSDKPVPELAVSIGITQFVPGEDINTFFVRADKNGLLIAKQQEGKNAIGLVLHPSQNFSVNELRSTIDHDNVIDSANREALINHIEDHTLLISK